LAFLALKELFFGEDTEKKTETMPVNTETESSRKEAESTVNFSAFQKIPAEIPSKPAIVPIPYAPKPVIPPLSVPPSPKISVTQTPPPIKRKFVTREDMAIVFQHGARALTRTEAVAALKNLGFGKTAAYEALLENGRFSAWLQFAPDGKITWTE